MKLTLDTETEMSPESREFGRLVERVFKEINKPTRDSLHPELRKGFRTVVEIINQYSDENLVHGRMSDKKFNFYNGLCMVLQEYVSDYYRGLLKTKGESQ